jgi:small ligand-binding sensory domain FIST
LVLATAAAGDQAFEIGERLALRWPEATFAGSGFEGLLAEGRAWVGQPAVALLAWSGGTDTPQPLLIEAEALAGREEALVHLEADLQAAVGGRALSPDDMLLLFPDAIATPDIDQILGELASRTGGACIAGAAAAGPGGDVGAAWIDGERDRGAALALLIPGGSASARAASRLHQAVGSRFASPWLEVSRTRGSWIDQIEGEPATDWVRRQLSLAPHDPIEPWLDRLLLRLKDRDSDDEAVDRLENDESRIDYAERYLVGVSDQRGSIALAEPVRAGDRVAFALPDADVARSSLRSAVGALGDAPVLLQLSCRARDAWLHGDDDLESAVVLAEAGDRVVIGLIAPFQVAPALDGRPRLQVHRTQLIALGVG